MTWFWVDDHLSFHRKTVQAGNAAMGLWVRAGSWCAASGTQGHIDTAVARQLGTKGQAEKLVSAGLWIPVDDGYQFHEWTGWQGDRPGGDETRRKRSEAGRRGGIKSGETRRNESKQNGSKTEANASNPVPSRPVPGRGPVRRSLQVVGLDPSDDDIDNWTNDHPGVDLQKEAQRFADYNGGNGAELRKPRSAWLAWLAKAQRSTPQPPSLHALCSEHALDSKTCPHCKAEEAS